MVIDDFLNAPKYDGLVVTMTQQSDDCHSEAKENDDYGLRAGSNFITVNSARRRKNNQNRVSWHNSYSQDAYATGGESAGESVAKIDAAAEGDDGTECAVNFRSAVMAHVEGERVEPAVLSKRTLSENESTSSPTLLITAPLLHNLPARELQQLGLFSAPIASKPIFSFDSGRHATSAEILPSISETVSPTPMAVDSFLRSSATNLTGFDGLPPEPLSAAPDSAVVAQLPDESPVVDSGRRRFVSYADSTALSALKVVNDGSNEGDEDSAIMATMSADIQHKRSASDNVVASASTFAIADDAGGSGGENRPGDVPSTSAQKSSDDDDLRALRADASPLRKADSVESSSRNFADVVLLSNRTNTLTSSLNNVRLFRDGIVDPTTSVYMFSASVQTPSTFSSNQYKQALLNSTAEVRLRHGDSDSTASPDGFYSPSGSSTGTISNGTFFKRSSLGNLLKKGKGEAEVSCNVLKSLSTNNGDVQVNHLQCERKKSSDKSAGRGSITSISSLVDRFTSRRQHSDTNLRRRLTAVQCASAKQPLVSVATGCDSRPTSLIGLPSAKETTSGDLKVVHQVAHNRRSFKWRSLFSTQKTNSVTTGNKENVSSRLFTQSEASKNRLKKSISLSYAIPTINLPEKSRTLTPLLEDRSPSADTSENSAAVKFRVPPSTTTGVLTTSLRPFSVIGSVEHDSKIILQRYRIDEENDRKFFEFLRLHEIDLDEPDDDVDMTRSSFADHSTLSCDTSVCLCDAAATSAANVDVADESGAGDALRVTDPLGAVYWLNNCPRHCHRNRNSFEKQAPVIRGLSLTPIRSQVSAHSTYGTLSRRRPRRAVPQSAGATRLRRRQSVSSTATSSAANWKPTRRPFSPCAVSPVAAHINNTIAHPSARAVRIQKRRMGSANRRRSSINVNQVLGAAIQLQQKRQLQLQQQQQQHKPEDAHDGDASDGSGDVPTTLRKSSEVNFNESAGRDALKAIIMRQHSMKQATKTKSEDIKWRKSDGCAEKEKKREPKSNGVILGTLLSIRHKKKTKDPRNLANVFPFHPIGPSTAAGGSATINRKDFFLDNRRSTHISLSESKNGLPDVLNNVPVGPTKDSHNAGSLASSQISLGGSETPTQSVQYEDLISSFPTPRLVKQKWQDLDLWTDEPGAWSIKHPDVNLPAAEKKRQNVIYEIYITEKHHCQVIVFLQQAYQSGLLNAGIMNAAEVKTLIPDVLDSLLDFHLRLLRRIRERVHSAKTVSTISDVIYEEFEEGEYRNAAINAYTDFCLARDDAHKVYAFHMERNINFRKFFDHYERDPEYKGRSFKSCLLLIAQRLTKYPLLIEQILKLDSAANKALSQRAHNAVKSFALKVDSELWIFELNRRWENLKRNMDRSSVGQLLGAPFTYEDLVHRTPEDPRKLLSISTVHWQSVTNQRIELSIVIFDDIVAFLQERNGVMQFFSQQDHASIIPLHTALIREMERTNEVMLIVLVKKKPDMYRLVFNNKTEMHNWISTFKKARLVAPHYVRTVHGAQHIDCGPPTAKSGCGTAGDEASGDPDEMAYNASMLGWLKQMESMFQERNERDAHLMEYYNDRLRFFDDLRRHIKNFPSRNPRSDSGILPPTMRVRENRDVERMKSVLRARLNDLKESRRSSLNQLVETAQRARDADVSLLIDELYADGSVEELRRELSERAIAKQSAASLPASKSSVTMLDSSVSSSSSTNASSEEGVGGDESAQAKRRKPRRARTYHGTADSQKSSSSSSTTRRHTTVPKVQPSDEASFSAAVDDFTSQVEEQISQLPLRVGSRARRAATDLIMENVAMRIENNKLRGEIVLQDLHIASLRVKKAPVVETTEKLESLRQKHEDIQTQERDFRRQFERQMDELNRRREQMERREAELDEREVQLKAFAEAAAANFNHPQPAKNADNESNCNGNVSMEKNADSETPTGRQPPAAGYHSSHHSNRPVANALNHPASYCPQYFGGSGANLVIPLSNRPMTNLYGKLTNFRSGSAIHDVTAAVIGSTPRQSFSASSSTSSGHPPEERKTSGSTLSASLKSAKSPTSELAQVPRHLAVKTETKPASDKRKKK